jgi:hypothetical protein
MILKRLYELAEREQLMTELAFELHPVPYVSSPQRRKEKRRLTRDLLATDL